MKYCLGIESSCDETAAAILGFADDGSCAILAETISSQTDIHELYGGVVPELAARAHLANLPLVTDVVLKESGKAYSDLDLIGVTRGPGLKGCLLMGTSFAKAVALACKIPLVGVNHIEAHLHAAFLNHPELRYPFLSLVVSGGHTEIAEVSGLGKYRILARTIDDAAGEAFDKSANLLGFSYPGGASLAKLADSVERTRFKLPKVMRESAGFSFSGLKTAIALLVKEQREQLSNPVVKAELCYAIQESIVDALVYKLDGAAKSAHSQSVVVSGGVSANRRLRERVSAIPGIKAFFPKGVHCMDNGAMAAYVAVQRFLSGERADLGFETLPRWPIEEL